MTTALAPRGSAVPAPVDPTENVEILLAKADGLAKAAEKLNPEETGVRLARYESDVLFGIVGAALGGALGVTLPVAATVLSGALLGPAGALVGAATAVLLHRGRGQWRLERAVKKLDTSLAVVKRELEWASRQEGVPKERLNGLWKRYFDILGSFQEIAGDNLRDQSSLLDAFPGRVRPPRER